MNINENSKSTKIKNGVCPICDEPGEDGIYECLESVNCEVEEGLRYVETFMRCGNCLFEWVTEEQSTKNLNSRITAMNDMEDSRLNIDKINVCLDKLFGYVSKLHYNTSIIMMGGDGPIVDETNALIKTIVGVLVNDYSDLFDVSKDDIINFIEEINDNDDFIGKSHLIDIITKLWTDVIEFNTYFRSDGYVYQNILWSLGFDEMEEYIFELIIKLRKVVKCLKQYDNAIVDVLGE